MRSNICNWCCLHFHSWENYEEALGECALPWQLEQAGGGRRCRVTAGNKIYINHSTLAPRQTAKVVDNNAGSFDAVAFGVRAHLQSAPVLRFAKCFTSAAQLLFV